MSQCHHVLLITRAAEEEVRTERAEEGESRLESQPRLGSPPWALCSLQAAAQRSGGLMELGLPPFWSCWRSLIRTFPQRRRWEAFSNRQLILESKAHQPADPIKTAVWKGELPGPTTPPHQPYQGGFTVLPPDHSLPHGRQQEAGV